MKINLVFHDWMYGGKKMNNFKGIELSMRDFHGGSTFKGEIHLDEEQEKELRQVIKQGYQPVFWVAK